MELAEAEAHVRHLAAQFIAEQARLEEATRKVAGLRKVLAGYTEMYPELGVLVEELASGVPLGDDGRPRGAEAVRVILQDSPTEWFRVSELVDLLRQRGWLPESENPANAVRAALERLVASEDSDVVRGKFQSGAVGYRYDPDRDRSPPQPPSGYGYDEEPF